MGSLRFFCLTLHGHGVEQLLERICLGMSCPCLLVRQHAAFRGTRSALLHRRFSPFFLPPGCCHIGSGSGSGGGGGGGGTSIDLTKETHAMRRSEDETQMSVGWLLLLCDCEMKRKRVCLWAHARV